MKPRGCQSFESAVAESAPFDCLPTMNLQDTSIQICEESPKSKFSVRRQLLKPTDCIFQLLPVFPDERWQGDAECQGVTNGVNMSAFLGLAQSFGTAIRLVL